MILSSSMIMASADRLGRPGLGKLTVALQRLTLLAILGGLMLSVTTSFNLSYFPALVLGLAWMACCLKLFWGSWMRRYGLFVAVVGGVLTIAASSATKYYLALEGSGVKILGYYGLVAIGFFVLVAYLSDD